MTWMTVIADLHGRLPRIHPESTMILLAGDIAPDFKGRDWDRATQQIQWLEGDFARWIDQFGIPVIAVPGNHDLWFWWQHRPKIDWYLLEHSHAVVNGFKIWGFGDTLDHGERTGFSRESEMFAMTDQMPDDCDILLTHNPPLGILDQPSAAKHKGSLALSMALYQKKPKLHVFGHVHEARGCKKFHSTYCINATMGSGCGSNGLTIDPVHPPWGLADNSWR